MRRLFSNAAAAAVIVTAHVTGCGGNVVVDAAQATGGAVGTGGTTTSSTSTSSSSTTASSSSTAASSSSSGTTNGCPVPFPGVEAACTTPGMTCAVPGACCQGTAVCENGFWKFLPFACQQPCSQPCGPDGFACALGFVCVANIAQTTTYQCATNPCAGTLDCSCAGQLCVANGLSCNNIQMGFKVLCD